MVRWYPYRMPMRRRETGLEMTAVRLPKALLDEAERLMDEARDWPEFAAYEPNLSAMLRVLLKRGLERVKAEPRVTSAR